VSRIVVVDLVGVALLGCLAVAVLARGWLPPWLEGRTTPRRVGFQCLGTAGLVGAFAVPALTGNTGDGFFLASTLAGLVIFAGCLAWGYRDARPRPPQP